jgi:hypothetical protein
MSQQASQIKISKSDLQTAAAQNGISADQTSNLWNMLSASRTQTSGMLQFIYYFGALLMIAAMTWFMSSVWDKFGGDKICLIALCYGTAFFASGYLLWRKKGLQIPGGLLITAAVFMVPLAIFGLEKYSGIWPADISSDYMSYQRSWVFMEIGTILAGFLALRFVRFPFITAPIAGACWFLSTDITSFLFGESKFPFERNCGMSILFGLVLLLCSYILDRTSKKDFAFWGYLFGTLSFWGGFCLLTWNSEFNWFLYFLINMGLLISSVFLERKVLMVFGTLGVFDFLRHLTYEIFKDSIVFPFALSFIGIIILCLAIFYQKHRFAIKTFIVNSKLTEK